MRIRRSQKYGMTTLFQSRTDSGRERRKIKKGWRDLEETYIQHSGDG